MASEHDVVVFPGVPAGRSGTCTGYFMVLETDLRPPYHLIPVKLHEPRSLIETVAERAAKYPFERFLIEDILQRWR
jgi:hypothetical protein